MWGRKKKSVDADAQPSIEAAAPASYWATHSEPSAAGTEPAVAAGQSEPVVVESHHGPRIHMAFTKLAVNGQPMDPDSPIGKRMFALAVHTEKHVLSAKDIDGQAIVEALAQPGGSEHLAQLLPLIEQHMNHEISDAEFQAAQSRILGAGGAGKPG
jgi:hypothetical protein